MNHKEIEILLVEDNPADAELTLLALRSSKVANTVHWVHDGAEALDCLFSRGEYAAQTYGAPKVVLLDLKLPKVDGLEVLQAIRADEKTRLLPVVVLTSSKEQKDIVNSYKLHVNSYIQKPVNFEQFQQTIEQLGFYWLVVNQPPPVEAWLK
jgi:CheY-like chemotaxis protein